MKTPGPHNPPRPAVAILRACLPAGFVGESLLGDLQAEFVVRSGSTSRPSVTAWYWIQTLRLSSRYLYERATHRRCYEGPGGLPSRPPGKRASHIRYPMLETILSDIRYSVRTLRKEPGWAAGAIGTLALAIGATTSIFSVVNSVLIKPLDYHEPHRLMALEFTPANSDAEAFFQGDDETRARYFQLSTTYPNFEKWRETVGDVIEDLAVYDDAWSRTVNFGAGTERIPAAIVSAGALRALGVPPAQGRLFLDEEDVPGSDNAVILSHSLWRSRFSSGEEAVGRTTYVDEKPHTIVGVMPNGFQFPTASSQVWLPMAESSRNSSSWNYEVFGRLRNGISIEQASALLGSRRIETTLRDGAVHTYAATLTPLHFRFVGDARPLLVIFMAAVFAVLLIACVNVINLTLTRSTRRSHELVVRGALGAGPKRISQQLLTESLLVCFAGAALGLLMAVVLTDLLIALSPDSIPRREQIGIDGSALSFTLSLAVVVGLAVGIAPALHASRTNLATGLSSTSRSSSSGSRHGFRVMVRCSAYPTP